MMNRTPANKTLSTVAAALALAIAVSPSALASTGGASAPTGVQPAASKADASKPAKTHTRNRHGRGVNIATWFGPGFYGKSTACGQTMTPTIVGVASRSLPCGTLVLVSYRGHTLTVPVIDRGPYAHNGATWDLTHGAAQALTMTETATIATRIVGRAANSPLLGAPVEAQPLGQSAPTVDGSGGAVAP